MNITLEYRNIVHVEISGETLKNENLVALENAIVSLHNINDHVNILIRISHLKWVTWKAAVESVRMLLKSKDIIKKVAIVSNKKVYELGAEIDNFFTPWEEKYFDITEIDEAWTWLKAV